MSLKLIVGPPNSGRAGVILERLREALGRDPLLIVPTGEDVTTFERDLSAGGAAAIGASIRTFAALFDDLAADAPRPAGPRLSDPQRLALVRAAVAATPLRLLRRSSASPGFAPALDSLIAELQAALVDPAGLEGAAEALGEGAGQELELAELYAAYERLRDGAGSSDAGSLAIRAINALREGSSAWDYRPVLIYGFDDLTEAQLALIGLLAERTEVTLAVNYDDRAALAARAGLLARVLEDGAEIDQRLTFDPSYTARRSLRHLSENLFEPDASQAELDGAVRILDSGGERGEAETVGIEVARLIAAGTAPDAIVVVLRNPAAEGPLFASVLRSQGVPVTLEAQLPLAGTAVGRSLVALCRAASDEAEPADVLAHMRSDTAARPGRADWAERTIARGEVTSVEALMERWGETPPAHLARVLGAARPIDRVRAIALCARRIAERAHLEAAPLAGERTDGVPLDPVELRAAVAAAELLSELVAVAALPGLDAPSLIDAAEALESASVRSWHGSTEGRVRIVGPARARAARAEHLFACGLQEGTFPGRGLPDPLLGEEARARLGIPALRRRDLASEERYLFHVCVSRPTEGLVLSWRSSDDEGHPAARSPFVDEVLDLLGVDPEATEGEITLKRGLAHSVPDPAEATTPRILARALVAAVGREPERQRDALDALGADLVAAGDVLALTTRINPTEHRPGPLSHPAVLSAIAERESLSAGSLENWIECSYRWFVSHELSPQRLERDADPLWLGGLVHSALHQLYLEPPGEDSIPRPGDVGEWKRRFSELIDGLVAGPDATEPGPDRRLALARVRIQVEAFLDEEAERETILRPRAELLERSFGFPENEGDPGALVLGDFTLRGFIDRIDVAPDGRRALVRDYKTSKAVSGRVKIADDGKLQLPLYMIAARDLLGLDPVAGLYHPLAAYRDRRGRGIALDEEIAEGGVLESEGIMTRTKWKDNVPAMEFSEELEAAREKAISYGAKMREGRIARNPLGGKCPRYCSFQPICRLERAVGLEEEFQVGGDD